MSVEIITGVGSSAHVSSTDQQAINQGLVGSGCYVFNVGSQLKAEITTNNLITVKDGVFCVGGIMGRIPAGATDGIAIDNGTSGDNRTDLIVLEYTKTGTIEKIEWKVLKGTTSYRSGDTLNGDALIQYPMYKVTIEGLTVSKVESMFKKANPIAGEAIAESSSDTTVVELTDSKDTTQFKTWPLSIKKVNGIVFAKYKGIHNMRANQKVSFTGTIPKAYRPETDECVSVTTINNNKPSGHCMFDFTSAGKVSVISNVSGTQEVRFSASWPAKEA